MTDATIALVGVPAAGLAGPSNSIVNSTMLGAVAGTPGTLPTNWNLNSNGTTLTIVGTGVENGVPYIDFRFVGTTTGTTFAIIFQVPATMPQIIAASGETWTLKGYHRLIAGSWTNITATHLQINELLGTTNTTVQSDVGPDIIPTGASLDTQRSTYTVTVSGGPTVGSLRPQSTFSTTTSVAVDFTVRVGQPVMYKEIGTPLAVTLPQLTGVQAIGQILPSPNSILNPMMAGAVPGTPGTPPTNWVTNNAGLTRTVVGVGVEDSIPYIDLRMFGATTGTNGNFIYQAVTGTPIPAVTGQTWTEQVYMRLIAGDFTNVTAMQHTINEYTGITQLLGNQGPSFFPTTASLASQRYDYTVMLNGGPTVNVVRPATQFTLTAIGVLVDFTVRIGYPLLYQSPNGITNSTMQGAVVGTPGTLPTNWGFQAAGLTSSIVGTGIENTIPYIDIRYNGIPTSTFINTTYHSPSTVPYIVAANRDTWTMKVYHRLVAGDWTNVPHGGRLLIREQAGTGSSTVVQDNFGPDFFPTNASLDLQRNSYTVTLSGGATVGSLRPSTYFPVTPGMPVDFTIRIGLPLLYKELPVLTPVIAPSPLTSLLSQAVTGRQNTILNNTMQGAVVGTPGTQPTYWNCQSAGLAVNVVGLGVESGLPYIDVQFVGTTSGSNGNMIYQVTNAAVPILALSGQTWTERVYMKLVAGDFTNITSIHHMVNEIFGTGGGGTVLQNAGPDFFPTGAALGSQRYDYTVTLSGGPTVGAIRPATLFNVPMGVAVNFTMRIGLPILYREGEAAQSDVIGTPFSVFGSGRTMTVVIPMRTIAGVRTTGLVGTFFPSQVRMQPVMTVLL